MQISDWLKGVFEGGVIRHLPHVIWSCAMSQGFGNTLFIFSVSEKVRINMRVEVHSTICPWLAV